MPSPRRSSLIVAWTGAAAFAASLLWFVYCYLVVFGRPVTSGPVLEPLIRNFLLFSVFALHHSVFARSRVKAMLRQVIPAELERSLYTWVASALLAGVCLWWQPVPGVIYELTGPLRIAGWMIQAVGLVFTIRASNALDVLDLAGVPSRAARWSRCRQRTACVEHERTLRVRAPSVVLLVGDSSSSPVRS